MNETDMENEKKTKRKRKEIEWWCEMNETTTKKKEKKIPIESLSIFHF